MVVGGKPVKDEANQNAPNAQAQQDQADTGDGDLGLVGENDQNEGGQARGIGDTRGSGDTR